MISKIIKRTVDVSTTGSIHADTSQIKATVSEIVENTPPDPQGTDTKPNGFTLPYPTLDTSNTVHEWTTYTCEFSGGAWEYEEIENTAMLRTVAEFNPDDSVPTAKGKKMKSGYGINASVVGQIVSDSSEYELPQTVIAYFPEFQYESYWRILNKTNVNSFMATFEFKNNEYSMNNSRVHFTPVWFPDGDYKPLITVRDAWTPVGELKGSFTAGLPIQIEGSVYDDWFAKEAS